MIGIRKEQREGLTRPGKSPLLALFLGFCSLLLGYWSVGVIRSPKGLYWAQNAVCEIAIIVVYVVHLRKRIGISGLVIMMSAFLVRSVGCAYSYTTISDLGYWDNPTIYVGGWDFEWWHLAISALSTHWHNVSIWSGMDPSFYQENKNQILIHYCAIVYYFSQNTVLSMATWSAVHQIATAVLLASLSQISGPNKNLELSVLFIVAFWPEAMFTFMWRDSVGWTALALGIYLVVKSRGNLQRLLVASVVAATLGYSVREVYSLSFGAVMVYSLYKADRLSLATRLFTMAACTLIAISFVLSSGMSFMGIRTAVFGRYLTDSQDALSITRVATEAPGRLVKALFGGIFPWYQIFSADSAYSWWDVVEIFQATLNWVLYVAMFWRWREWRKNNNAAPLEVLLGVSLILVVVLGTAVHATYIAAGTLFFVPEAVRCGRIRLGVLALLCFVGFLCANVFYSLIGVYGTNITGIY